MSTARIITSGVFDTGSQVAGASGAGTQLQAPGFHAVRGVTVRAAEGNSADVYVGPFGVTCGVSNAVTDGYPLKAGESKTFEVDDPAKLYIASASASQSVNWFAV